LPGIGAYLARATAEQNLAAVGWVVLTMTVVIILYDQLMFRPLVAWADKFRFEQTGAQTAPGSWFLDLLHRSRLFQTATRPVSLSLGALSRWRLAPLREGTIRVRRPVRQRSMPLVCRRRHSGGLCSVENHRLRRFGGGLGRCLQRV
jgi:NitT/TauT family transport system permease protein